MWKRAVEVGGWLYLRDRAEGVDDAARHDGMSAARDIAFSSPSGGMST